MSNLIVKDTPTTRFPVLEAGSYLARCYAIIDIGEHFNKLYGNTSRKVIFMWELPTETITIDGEEKPRAISETYTMSFNEKANMRKMLENWRGRAFTAEELAGFDLENVLKAPCMVSVVHRAKQNGDTFAAIGSVSKLPKGMDAPELFNTPVIFSLQDTDALDKLQTLPEWVQNRIRESETYKAMMKPGKGTTEAGDQNDFVVIDETEDLPF